jgi:hypothetical protein
MHELCFWQEKKRKMRENFSPYSGSADSTFTVGRTEKEL